MKPGTKAIRIALVANTDWYLANFRLDLANALRDRGAEVHCIAPPGKYLDRLAGLGFVTHALDLGDDSFSLFGNRRTYTHLVALYREIRPDLVHHFTPRCVVLGSMAARRAGVPRVINALTGLGHVFTSRGVKARLVRPVVKGVLRRYLGSREVSSFARSYRVRVVFQNRGDMDEMVQAGIVASESCRLIRGSGVDTDKFRPAAGRRDDDELRVFFASRLIAEKGVNELLAAMEKVVASQPNALLWIAGGPYAQNPTSLTEEDMERLHALPWVKCFGHVDNVHELLGQVDIVALPSFYREGTPKILLEAAACALPIVATDIAGCRGVVEEGENGFLVPVKDTALLAKRIGQLCGDADLRKSMGVKGREIIVGGFSSEIVVGKTLGVYRELLGEDFG